MQITDLLAFGVKNKASDLHLSAGLPPMIRVHGDIRRINLPEMSSEEVGQMITSVMNDQPKARRGSAWPPKGRAARRWCACRRPDRC